MANEIQKSSTFSQTQHLLKQYESQIAMALPKHMTAERVIRIALSAVSGSSLLLKCEPLSICAVVVQASILGLELNSQLGEAYIVPFWNSKAGGGRGGYQAQLMPGYKGIVKLARNTGQFSIIDAQPVRENDEFVCEKGFNPVLYHKWDKGDRGPIIGYYGAYVLKEGGRNFEYMSVEDINAHRDKYSKNAYKLDKGKPVLDENGNKILTGPWKDSPDWMYRKTPLKQVLKLAPQSVERELATAIALDEIHEAGKQQVYVDVPLELQPAADEAEERAQIEMPARKSKTEQPEQAELVATADA